MNSIQGYYQKECLIGNNQYFGSFRENDEHAYAQFHLLIRFFHFYFLKTKFNRISDEVKLYPFWHFALKPFKKEIPFYSK